jgi:hypothetical protein
MADKKRLLDRDHEFLWGLFDKDTRDNLTDGEITFLNNAALQTPPAGYQAVIAFQTAKANYKIAQIYADASKDAKNAAETTKKYSERIFWLTVVLASAAGVQAAIAIASTILNVLKK